MLENTGIAYIKGIVTASRSEIEHPRKRDPLVKCRPSGAHWMAEMYGGAVLAELAGN